MDDCKSYFLETGRRVSFEYTLLGTLNVPSQCIYLFLLENIVEVCLLFYPLCTLFFHINMGDVNFVTSWDQ